MRKVILLALVFLTSFTVFGQDFSNKGTEFWTCFPNHIPSGSNGQMTIWITSDQPSSGVVSITNGSFSAPFSVAANGIVPINIPYANAHISNAESGMVIQKSIKIKVNPGQPAVVAYAQQYGNARSAATLLLPTNVLGKKYRAFSFTHTPTSAGGQNSRSQFQIIATQPNTQVEVTPILNGIKSATFTIVFPNVGDMYQYQASADVTGTLIESIATGSGSCLPIAVFSGNSAVTIGTPTCNGNSYDPLFQQCYPITTWGKNYGFIPFGDYTTTGNPYRVMASEDNTTVSFNGSVVAVLNAGQIYPAAFTSNPVLLNQPTFITADRPISVAHYLQTSACSGSNNGDPDMVILNPIEQNIKDITVFASTQQNITRQWINVLIPTVAAPSFRIDGLVPTTAFVPAPNIPGYSFLRHMFNPAINGSHYLTADSGFNAVLYGYQGGNFESYAYSAGTNVRDLSQQLELQTTYGIETSPSVCTTAPFVFKVYFPDSTLGTPPVAIRFDSLKWDISNPALIVPNNFPIMYHGTVGSPPTVAIDSTNIRNGRKVNWYSLPTTYYFNTSGYDSLLVTGYTSTNEGCGSTREYIFSVQISDPPTASFTTNTPGCYLVPVTATETTPQLPKATYKQWWEFYDPVTNLTTVYSNMSSGAAIRTVSHSFTTPGTKTIRHVSITTPGCLSDTIVHTVNLPDLPNASISGNTTPVCINSAVGPDVVFTGTLGTPEYVFTYRINGGAPITSFPSSGGVLTIQAPTNVAGTFIYELLSVQNQGAAVCSRPISGQTVTITITPDATVTLRPGDNDNQTVCINNPIVNIRYDIGGSGNGGTVTGLPAGVTGTYAGGVVTITGTPTTAVGSPFTYTIVPTGPCAFPVPAITGRITVNDDATISLTSAAGTDDQTKCINTVIDNIDYLVARGGTGATIAWTPSTPPGISFTPLGGGNFRIAGTPTAAGTFNYTISTAGPCIIPTATGRLIVTPDATVSLRPGDNDNQAVCVNNPIVNIRYDIGGSGNGGTVTGLPPGVTGTYAGGVITITGTPTTEIGSPFIYTIVPTGPCAFPVPPITGRITVTGDATLALTSVAGTDAQELCRNTAINNITYDFGGTATGATVTGLPAGVTWSVSGNRVTITGTPTVSSPTAYTYTVSTAGPCVRPNLTGTILVNALPTASFTFTTPSCETRDITFTDGSTANVGALDQWTWTFGDPASGPLNTSGSQNPTHVYATPGAYNVTLSVRNDKGCISDPISAQVININHRPVAGFIVPDVCINDIATTFTDTSKIAVGTINRPLNEWNYGDPASGPLNNSIGINGSHLYPAPGIYNVRQIVTSALGCRDTIILPITINSADPVSQFSINNAGTLCSSDSVELVNLSTVGFGNVTRLEVYWDNVGAPGSFQTINAPAFNGVYRHKYPTSATTRNYTIRMIAYSGVICSAQRTANITVYATPQVQFNAIPDACLLVAPYQITQGSEIGGVPGTGTYSGPGITNPNGTFNPQLAGIGTHAIKYTFTASNAGACIDTLTRFITVLDTAHAKFSFVTPSCEQVPTSFTDLSTAPAGVTLGTTVWDFGDGTGLQTFPAGATFNHIFATPGTFTVRMHNVSTYGCLSTDTTAQVTIDANHAISSPANNIQTRCVNNAIAPIVYTLSGGATNVTVANLPPGVTYAVSGTTVTISGSPTTAVNSPYNYTIQTTGNTCAVASASGSITVDPDHTIALRAGSDTAQSVCINTPIDPIIYDLGGGATGAVVSNLPPGVNYTIAGNILTISGTPTAIPAVPGFTITTTGNTCLTAGTIGEIVVHPYPVPSFTVDKPNYCIPNAIVKFTNTSTTPDGSGMTYVWNFGDGSPQELSISPTHWYTSGIGPFTVRLSATSIAVPVLNGGAQGCNSFIDVVMNSIHPQPKADFVFNKPSVCIGDNVTITDNTDGKDGIVNQWHWELGDGTTRITNPITHTYADTIAYTITMYSINNFGCNSDTISKVYNVYPYPHVNAGPDRFVLEGGSILLETVSFANDPTYSWSPAQYLTDSKIARPRVMSPKTDMTYRFTVTGRGGCQLSDDVFVKLLRFPVIPNTFTPNGDGINDTWRIDFLNTYPENRVQIFTRTGQLVFQSRGYNTPWDGTLKGKPLPFDTYYYIIEPGNGRDPITGYVTILK